MLAIYEAIDRQLNQRMFIIYTASECQLLIQLANMDYLYNCMIESKHNNTFIVTIN